jgi:hypothetical protein
MLKNKGFNAPFFYTILIDIERLRCYNPNLLKAINFSGCGKTAGVAE